MKLGKVCLTSLIAASVWVNFTDVKSLKPVVKVDDKFVPLHGIFYKMSGLHAKVLVYESPLNLSQAIIFTLKDNYVSTNETLQNSMGLQLGVIALASFMEPTSWNLDIEDRVLDAPFYTCNFFNNNWRYIQYGVRLEDNKRCSKVDFYLTETGAGKSFLILKVPYVFVAKCRDK